MKSGGEKLILLIDDDDTANFLHNLFIEEVVAAGIPSHSFQMATDALFFLDACARVKNEYEIVIFLDINMPVMDGFEFLESLQSKRYKNMHLDIVILTSSLHPRDKHRAENFEVYRYLHKPLNEKLLRNLFLELGIPVKS